ncbi:MAG: SGNH/GDSL hydrolase family protein [Fimbriimonas sp.]
MLTALLFAATVPADPKTYLADVVREMSKTWPQNRTVEIVCHGHSVPAGYFVTPTVDTFNAYPHLLHVGLKARFPKAVINVSVTAIGGENSVAGERRFAKDVLARNPDVVTIDYGLNDRRVDPAAVSAAWTSMIAQAKARGIKVILLTPTGDTSAKMDDPNDPIVQQAVAIRALAQEHDVALVDSLALYLAAVKAGTPLESLMSQVNHPNRAGHDLVTKELLRWFPPSP